MDIPNEIISAVLGALVGAFITYRFALYLVSHQHRLSVELADREARRRARARFKAAFAPTQAFIYIAQKHGTHDRPDVDGHVRGALLSQGAAVEEFRPFIESSRADAFQRAWEAYRAVAAGGQYDRAAEEWDSNLEQDQLVQQRISELVSYAEI